MSEGWIKFLKVVLWLVLGGATVAVGIYLSGPAARYVQAEALMQEKLGVRLYTAWTSTGVYLTRFAFTSLLLASFIEPVLQRFVEPHRKVLRKVHKWLEDEFAAFGESTVNPLLRSCYEDRRAEVKAAEADMDKKIRLEIEQCYGPCFYGSCVALAVTLLGVDNMLGPVALVLTWPTWILWFRCKRVWDEAEQQAQEAKTGFEKISKTYKKGLHKDITTGIGSLKDASQIPHRPPFPEGPAHL